jgi:hypothetical protein
MAKVEDAVVIPYINRKYEYIFRFSPDRKIVAGGAITIEIPT